MRRRDILTGIVAAQIMANLPRYAIAQERARRIGVLIPEPNTNQEALRRLETFRTTLARLGWDREEKLRLLVRWGNGNERLAEELARELVRSRPDAVFVIGLKPLAALKRLTTEIPILFMNVTDPVGQGLVVSLARPGGNITGFMNFDLEIAGKWRQMVREAVPGTNRILVIAGRDSPWVHAVETAVSAPGLAVTVADVAGGPDIRAAVAAFVSEPAGAVIITPGAITNASQKTIVALAADHRLPGIYPNKTYIELGGLMSCSPDDGEQSHRAAVYMDRVLRGEKPGDLPVQAPETFRLVLNLKTARAFGLTIPPSLLARADEVIE